MAPEADPRATVAGHGSISAAALIVAESAGRKVSVTGGNAPRARFAIEEQFSDGSERAVVRWRDDWGEGHVRGVDIVRVRDGRLAESLA